MDDTQRALVQLFQNSTLTEYDIKELGVLLEVGLNETKRIIINNSYGKPYVAAIEVCSTWIKGHQELTKVTAATQLYKALRSIDHGRIAGNLIHHKSRGVSAENGK